MDLTKSPAPWARGGMGEVYKARDTKLDRDVAVKVLPASLARDPERLSRFEREAKVLASLNHPNIAQIYGLQEAEGIQALVMELVPGATLRGPVPVDQALGIAGQVAEALAAAHDKGITHRDLKPANVMITPDGVVKVLDFGLAAVSQPSGSVEGNPTNSPTLTLSPTRAGMILGTAAYMSPEQARGQTVDRRADIWAFGVLLWEMLTGRQLFRGETVSDILAGVLKDEPDFEQVPEQVRPLLRRCLQKEPKKRLQAIGDWELLLSRDGNAAGSGAVDPSAVPGPAFLGNKLSRLGLAGWIAAGVLGIAAVAFGFVAYRHGAEEPPRVVKTSVLPPEKAFFVPQSPPAVSPDGRRLAFVAMGARDAFMLWVRDLDSLEARPLPGTEGAFEPFWSPDSRSVAFFASGKLKKIEVAGGPVLTLCDVPGAPREGSWSKNDVIVFGVNSSTGLLRVSAAGGNATPVTTVDSASGEFGHGYPWFLPDGHHFLYLAVALGVNSAVYVGDVDSKDRQRVTGVLSNAIYSPPGYLLFVRERTLMAQPFDAVKLQTSGDAVPLAEQVAPVPGINGQYVFSASQNGILTYLAGGESNLSQLTWFDRQGKPLGPVWERGNYQDLSLSPDGRRVAIHSVDGQNDLWLFEFARNTSTRFTFDPSVDQESVWSPDGSRIVWGSNRSGVQDLYRKASNGAGEEQILLASGLGKVPDDWSPDGRFFLYSLVTPKAARDLMVLPLNKDGSAAGSPSPFLATPFNESHGRFSPDGGWVAYTSDESGRSEVYVRPFPASSSGGKWQVSVDGGYQPLWRRDGKELLYFSPDSKLMSVEVGTSPAFKAATPKTLFAASIFGGPVASNAHRWDISPDGQRFLINVAPESTATVPLTVVQNWQPGLKK